MATQPRQRGCRTATVATPAGRPIRSRRQAVGVCAGPATLGAAAGPWCAVSGGTTEETDQRDALTTERLAFTDGHVG
jgi:hypothetical protein